MPMRSRWDAPSKAGATPCCNLATTTSIVIGVPCENLSTTLPSAWTATLPVREASSTLFPWRAII